MEHFFTGDFVCLKNHPYFEFNSTIKISANAEMTPPVMVISEVLDKNEFDSTTGQNIERQFKCYYYSHKDGKYHDKWIKEYEIKKLTASNTYLDLDSLKTIEDYDLEFLKKKYIGKTICLKSIDFELTKKKVFIDSSNGKHTNKENNHLSFLPPVMTIIDILKNKDEKRYSTKNKGIIEKDCAKYLFKCKWYNPITTSYSEELLPSNILGLIKNKQYSQNSLKKILDENLLVLSRLDTPLSLENSSIIIKNSLLDIYEIVYNHYYYNINYFDFLFQKYSSSEIEKIHLNLSNNLNFTYTFNKNDVLGEKLPKINGNTLIQIKESTFIKDQYYLIKYIDRFDNITNRVIRLKGNIKVKQGRVIVSTVIEANCLLRNGKIRHFNIDRIISSQLIINGTKLFE